MPLSNPSMVAFAVATAAAISVIPVSEAFAAESITTTGVFSSFSGDVDAVSGPGAGAFEVYVNDRLLRPGAQIINDRYQGTMALPAGTTSVEFKTRQPGLPFNTPNVFAFAGTTVSTPASLSTPFLLGTITITNGIWFSQASAVLTVSTSSPGSPFDARSFTDTLRYTVTPNVGTDEQNADFAVLNGHPGLGQIRVYEASSGLGNTGTVQLYGRAGSLIPLYFANPTGGVFIQAIPEPQTWLMMALGGVAIALSARRSRSQRA